MIERCHRGRLVSISFVPGELLFFDKLIEDVLDLLAIGPVGTEIFENTTETPRNVPVGGECSRVALLRRSSCRATFSAISGLAISCLPPLHLCHIPTRFTNPDCG